MSILHLETDTSDKMALFYTINHVSLIFQWITYIMYGCVFTESIHFHKALAHLGLCNKAEQNAVTVQ